MIGSCYVTMIYHMTIYSNNDCTLTNVLKIDLPVLQSTPAIVNNTWAMITMSRRSVEVVHFGLFIIII